MTGAGMMHGCGVFFSSSAVRRPCAEKSPDEVWAAYASQLGCDPAAVGGIVPEKELSLRLFLRGCCCGEHFFSGVGVDAGVVHFRGKCHRRGCEVLHLLEMEVQVLCFHSQFGHVFDTAAGMR